MIRINLLETKKAAGGREGGMKFDFGGQAVIAAVWIGVLLLAAGYIGIRWYTLSNTIEELADEIQDKEQERRELEKALKSVEERQQKKDALERRVELISDLKRRQRGPVHLLDQVSRQLPEFLWLEGLEERDGAIQVRGKAMTYNAVSNFYNNLQGSPYFSEVSLGTVQQVPNVGVSFQLSCRFAPPNLDAEGGDEASGDDANAAS